MNRGGGIWVAAFLVAGLAHVALLGFILPAPPPESRAPGAATDPVRIELGTAPSPALAQAEPAMSTPTPPEPEPKPQPDPEPKPKPEPAPTPEPEPEPQPDAKPQPEPDSRPEPEATAEAPAPADAGEPIPGEGSEAARRNYLQTLRAWLSQHQHYPRRARLRGLEGDAVVTLRFDDEGMIADALVSGSTGYRSLDEALQTMLERARPFPDPPDEALIAGRTIDVPIRFSLRDNRADF